jgi:hypothetical protein
MVIDDEELPHGLDAQLARVANPTAWARLRKLWLENNRLIHCSRCPYHRIENAWGFRTAYRNWKNYRDHQYKVREAEDGDRFAEQAEG